jgi:hypothetical protein
MVGHEIVELAAPLGGLRRDAGFQQKPPFYTEDCLNVRAFDVIESRGRVGSRPGLVKAFQQQLGSGADVNMSAVIRTFNESGTISFSDPFDGVAMTANWTSPSAAFTVLGTACTGTLPAVAGGTAQLAAAPSGSQARAAILTGTTDINTTAFREVSIPRDAVNGWTSETPGNNLIVYMDMDNASPSESGCVAAQVLINVGGDRTLFLRVLGSLVFTRNFSGSQNVASADFTELRLSINAANTVRVQWHKDIFDEYQLAVGYTPPAAPRVGFGLLRSSGGTTNDITAFGFNYTSTSGGSPPEAAVFASNGQLYREATGGTLASVSHAGLDLRDDIRIHAASRLDKLYILDYELKKATATTGFRKVKDGAATIVDGGTAATEGRLDDTAVADWTTMGIDITDDVLEIIDQTGTIVPGVYAIVSVHATNGITFSRVGAGLVSSEVAYRVVRYPKVYDATANTMTRVGLGTIGVSQFPAGCRSITLWADRLVVCNDAFTPHAWFMSASGYPLNWDYGDSGVITPPGEALGIAAAVAGTNSEFAGLIGEPLITTIPVNDDILIFACRTSFYALRGNPRLGGQIDNISREIGIVGIAAWCRTPDGKLFCMTPDGLYQITLAQAIPVSRDIIPQELLGLSDDRYEVSLNYDVARRGIVIACTATMGGENINFFFDERTGGFFPELFVDGHMAFSSITYQPGGVSMPTVLWGCKDGYVRKFEDAAEDDDGTDFDSYCYYGPVRLGRGEYSDGMLHEIVCVMDEDSNDVTLSAQVGHSAQIAKRNASRFSTTMTGGRNRNRYPRIRGGAAYLKVMGTPGIKWAVENITVTREGMGRLLIPG